MKQKLPDRFKVKIPPAETKELGELYDFLFDKVRAGWTGPYGHYAYDKNPDKVAVNQDGYIYCYLVDGFQRLITADSNVADEPVGGWVVIDAPYDVDTHWTPSAIERIK